MRQARQIQDLKHDAARLHESFGTTEGNACLRIELKQASIPSITAERLLTRAPL